MLDKVFCGIMVAAAVAIVVLWFGGCAGKLIPRVESPPPIAQIAPAP